MLVSLLLFSSSANAGLFSTLSKIGKATKNADVDIPLNRLELPDNIRDFTPAIIKPDADGQWNITQPDGTVTHIDDLLYQSTPGSSRLALVIRASDLPGDMQQFDNLPHDWPVFIEGKKHRLFELHRGESAALSYNNVVLRVKTMDEVRDGLWMLQRPSMARAVRFVKLDKKAASALPSNTYASGFAVESVAADGLIDSMKSVRNQTLVLSGRIIDGQLRGSAKDSFAVPMQKLQQVADKNDIRLVVLDSDQPDLVLKKVSHSMRQAVKDNHAQYESIGDFFNRLSDPDSPNRLELHASRSGENQIAIQWQATKAVTTGNMFNTNAEILKHMPVHLLLHSTLFYIQDQERSKELDDRIIPNVPSTIQFYVIISVVLGFTALGTSWRLWRKLWPRRMRSEYRYLLVFMLQWSLHRLLFLLLFIPTLGAFSFLWLLLLIIYKVFDWVLIKPSRWLYRLLAA